MVPLPGVNFVAQLGLQYRRALEYRTTFALYERIDWVREETPIALLLLGGELRAHLFHSQPAQVSESRGSCLAVARPANVDIGFL